jgi:hypothetical protein
MQEPIPPNIKKEHIEWLKYEFLGALNPPKVFVKDAKSVSNYGFGRKRVTTSLYDIKYKNILYKTKLSAVCLNASRNIDDKNIISSNYGMIYGDINGNIMYVCSGHTYNSKDGEYRKRFERLIIFDNRYDKNIEIFEQIESKIIGMIQSGVLRLTANFYECPESNIKKLEKNIDESRVLIRIYCYEWIRLALDKMCLASEPHSNFANIEQFNHNYDMFKEISKNDDSIITKIGKYNERTKLGQKLIPLTYGEIGDIENISFPPWKELRMAELCSNLVANFISPSFPLLNNWFVIFGSNRYLFNNLPMIQKFANSKKAGDIYNTLVEARNLGLENELMENKKFKELYRKISNPIDYINSNLRLSNICLAMVSEDVEKTLATHMTIKSTIYEKLEVEKNFKLYMLDYVYGFYCLNINYFMFHADAHLNNITIFQNGLLVDSDNFKTLYIIDENEAFIRRYNGYIGMIIDFSRSIMADEELIKKTLGEGSIKPYLKTQNTYMMHLIFRLFPEYIKKHENKIKALIFDKFSLMVKILSAVDIMSVSRGSADQMKKYRPSADVEYLMEMSKFCSKFILTNLQKAIDGTLTSHEDIDWPNRLILRKFFSEFSYKPGSIEWGDPTVDPRNDIKTQYLMGIFNVNAPVKYSMEKYETWPKMLRWDFDFDMQKKYGYELPEEYYAFIKFKDTNEEGELEEIAYEHRTEFDPVKLMSSWEV